MRGLFTFLHTSREDKEIKSWEKHLRVVDGRKMEKKTFPFFYRKWKYVKDVLEVDWMLMGFPFTIPTFSETFDFWAFLKIPKPSAIGGIIQSNSSSFN